MQQETQKKKEAKELNKQTTPEYAQGKNNILPAADYSRKAVIKAAEDNQTGRQGQEQRMQHVRDTFNIPNTSYQQWVWESVAHISWSMLRPRQRPSLELP